MGKTDNKILHQLIHSMSKYEKAQFKRSKLIDEADDTKYIQLFELLNNQAEYDKLSIITQLDSSTSKYAKMKNFLYRQLIMFLTKQQKAVSKNHRIENLLKEAEVLSNRKFYNAALKRIDKGINECKKYEVYDFLIKFCHAKRMVLLNTNDKKAGQILKTINEDIQYSIKEMGNYYELLQIGDELNILLIQKGHLNKEGASKFLSEQMNKKILETEDNAISHRSKQVYNFIHGAYQLIILNDVKLAAKYSKRRVELWKSHMSLVEITPVNYMGSLNNYIFFTFKLNLLDEAKTCIADLNAFREDYFHLLNKSTQSKLLEYILTNELQYFEITLNTNSSFSTLHQIEEFAIGHYRTMNNYAALVYYYIGLSHYYLNNLKQSQKNINEIINARQFKTLRNDVQVSALVIQLIILFDLKKYELLSYRISTFKYYLKAKKDNYPHLKELVNYLEKEINTPTNKVDRKNNLVALRTFFETKHQTSNSEILKFNLVNWANNKLVK